MAKSRVMFVCQDCGSEQNKWIGQCPDCNAWNTLVQFAQPAGPTAARAAAGRRAGYAGETAALRTLAEIISLPPRVRFARALQRLASMGGEVRLTQEELGRMVGMSRAAFRRSFAALIEQGIVEVEYGGIIIRDRAALDREAVRTDE